ncbi:MAG: alpha/beta hydrolase-fold protein [Chitinophagaceae bacterium]
MVRLYSFFIALFLFVSINISAQDTVWLTHGIALPGVHHYGREALYTDQLAFQLYNNALAVPEAGSSTNITDGHGATIKWQPLEADSLHRFRSRQLMGGYVYCAYTSEKEKVALLNTNGAGAIFFNGVPHAGDPYSSGWLYIPVKLKKGINHLYLRSGMGPITARLIFPATTIQLNTEDATLPSIVQGTPANELQGAVVVINASDKELAGMQIKSIVEGKTLVTNLPNIPQMSTRKCVFKFNGEGGNAIGMHDCQLILSSNGKTIDEKLIKIGTVASSDKYSNTFISAIDGSLQYYAVTPQQPAAQGPSALFLSVHGAGVEAIGQAKAYHSKDWGTLVAATNRRPRGFNWEDWGRLDALEVLAIAKEKFKPDPQHIYLTGHSMGGHGTWFLGATYPGLWAGIAPCSGYPTLKEYGSADGAIPVEGANGTEQMLLRASNQSDIVKLAANYKSLGIYILHGDSDKVVPVKYARQMKKVLADFHSDMSYYEYPGGEHWFGDQSVDWPPLFNFFKWHSRIEDSAFNNIDFTTSSPGISSSFRWAAILQQEHPLQYSHIVLNRNKKGNAITGTTGNVHVLQLALAEWAPGAAVSIQLDSLNKLSYTVKTNYDTVCLVKDNNQWQLATKPGTAQKGPIRYGTFKDPFNNKMVFVYSTKGTPAENEWSFNKARYDAETWYYRGNGSMDIIADKEYNPAKYAGRNIIIYGNANTNSAYNILLSDCPIRIERNKVVAGDHSFSGEDMAAYFTWPQKASANLSVGVVAGTGIKGMMATNANQYFAGASGFPDFMIFSLSMLQAGSSGIKMTGFFDNDWKIAASEMVAGN